MAPDTPTTTSQPDANQLAMVRTVMAADRTLMAWIRTAISLIGFGFTLFKFLQVMRQDTTGPQPLWEETSMALAFIGLAIFSLVIAVVQYRQFLVRAGVPRQFSLSLTVATLMALIGILALANVLFQMGPI